MANNRLYHKELDAFIEKTCTADIKPEILLHACCAPCSSYVLEYLAQYFDIKVFYYNPNISPREEYEFRLNELERLIRETGYTNVRMTDAKYDPENYEQTVKGLENEPEGGRRCEKCFRLRLEETAKKCVEQGIKYFTTTLTISPLKDAGMLNSIGEEMAGKYHLTWLPSDFKKKDGYKRSIELSREYGLYRQDYCGCLYSKR